MSTDGKSIHMLHKEFKKLLEQVEFLLRAAEKILNKRKWDCIKMEKEKYYFRDKPKSVLSVPWNVFAFFRSEKKPNMLVYISVLLNDDKDDFFQITEPLITAGWLNYGKEEIGEKEGSNWHNWYTRFHGYMSEPRDDRKWREVDPKKDWEGDDDDVVYSFKSVRTFGLPLVEITDEKSLIEKVINPLLEDIEKHSTGNVG